MNEIIMFRDEEERAAWERAFTEAMRISGQIAASGRDVPFACDEWADRFVRARRAREVSATP